MELDGPGLTGCIAMFFWWPLRIYRGCTHTFWTTPGNRQAICISKITFKTLDGPYFHILREPEAPMCYASGRFNQVLDDPCRIQRAVDTRSSSHSQQTLDNPSFLRKKK